MSYLCSMFTLSFSVRITIDVSFLAKLVCHFLTAREVYISFSVLYIQQHLWARNIKQQKNYRHSRSHKENQTGDPICRIEQVPTRLIKDVVLSDDSHHFSTKPFLMTTANAVLASLLICRESGSMSLLYKCTGVNIKCLKKVLEKNCLRSADIRHIEGSAFFVIHQNFISSMKRQ